MFVLIILWRTLILHFLFGSSLFALISELSKLGFYEHFLPSGIYSYPMSENLQEGSLFVFYN